LLAEAEFFGNLLTDSSHAAISFRSGAAGESPAAGEGLMDHWPVSLKLLRGRESVFETAYLRLP